MSWGYVAVGGAILIGSYLQNDAANKSADAAGKAAGAQLDAAKGNAAMIKQYGEATMNDAMKLAEASPQELSALDMSLASADHALKREEAVIANIDPAIMEAGKQALAILKGQTAETNKPMMALRDSQRQRIVNQLREQYGPSAELSALGQNALRKFDMETDSLFAENQQNALSQLFTIGNTDVGGRLTRGIGTLQQVGQGYGALNERKLNTRINTGTALTSALAGANQSVIQNAGAPYVGAAIAAQGQNQIGSNLAQVGGNMAGMMAYKKM